MNDNGDEVQTSLFENGSIQSQFIVSYTSLSKYLQCPLRYKLRYIDKINDELTLFYLSVGRSMHSTLKQFFSIRELEKRTEDQLISFLDENWISSGYSSNREEHEWFSKSVAMLKKYYREFDCMTKPLMLETNFKSQIDNLTIEGKFDRIDRLSGKECEIIDYKLGQPEGMFIDGPEDDYQWVFYYLGATKHFGLNISKISYHYIQASKKISLSPDADLAKEKFKQIQSIVADINMSTTFVAKSNKYCPNCSLYKRCCKEFDGGK